MTIALDYDHTITADPELFATIAEAAIKRGHGVIIATGRQPSDPVYFSVLPVVYCGHRLKEHACRDAGYKVDIWIDDMPGMIQDCRILSGGRRLTQTK